MKERLKLTSYSSSDKQERTIEVEYREVPHFYSNDETRRGRKLKQYEVLVDGELVGTVHSFEHHSHTTYGHSRIRRDLGYPLRWGWHNTLTRKNCTPGLYAETRRGAVSDMLGYAHAEKINA